MSLAYARPLGVVLSEASSLVVAADITETDGHSFVRIGHWIQGADQKWERDVERFVQLDAAEVARLVAIVLSPDVVDRLSVLRKDPDAFPLELRAAAVGWNAAIAAAIEVIRR